MCCLMAHLLVSFHVFAILSSSPALQVVKKTFAAAQGLEKKQLAYLLARQVGGRGQADCHAKLRCAACPHVLLCGAHV